MRRIITHLAITFVALAGALAFFEGPANAADVTLYKTPQCGCCEE